MIDLTYGELQKAPTLIQFIFISIVNNVGVGSKMIEEAMEKHPEYFPHEIERRNILNSIPQEVRDAFRKEYLDKSGELYEKIIEFRREAIKKDGLNTINWKEHWDKSHTLLSEQLKEFEKELYEKYYEPHGLKYEN